MTLTKISQVQNKEFIYNHCTHADVLLTVDGQLKVFTGHHVRIAEASHDRDTQGRTPEMPYPGINA